MRKKGSLKSVFGFSGCLSAVCLPMMAVGINLAADYAAQCRAAEGGARVAADERTCRTADNRAGYGVALTLVHRTAGSERCSQSNSGSDFE